MELEIKAQDAAALFAGGGEMHARCRAINWSETPLGPVDTWPAALRAMVRGALDSPFPINLWCGPELILIYNDAYRRILGAKHPEALGKPGRQVWREIWDNIAPLFDSILAGGPPVFAEDSPFKVLRADQSGRLEDAWFTFSLSPVRNDSGAIIAFLNIVAETTRRVRAEREVEFARQAAEHAEARLREIFAQAPTFLAVLRGRDHVFEFANDAYLQLVGNRDIIEKPVAEALPEVAGQGFLDMLDRVMTSGEAIVGREVLVRLARTRGAPLEDRYVDFIYQPLRDTSGAIVGIVANGTDVTEQVVARHDLEATNARLRASEERYQLAAKATNNAIWDWDLESDTIRWNDGVTEVFGHPLDRMSAAADWWTTMIHPADRERVVDGLRAVVEGGPESQFWNDEYRFLRGDGRYAFVSDRGYVARDERGRAVRMVGAMTDVTSTRAAAVERERLLRAERAARESAEKARAEADEASRAKSDFLATMSHELRTPLNAITGYTQLLELEVAGPITNQQRRYLERLRTSGTHLLGLVNDVLDLSKIEAGHMRVSGDLGWTGDAVRHALALATPQAEAKRIRMVDARSDERGEPYVGDPERVQQILINLLSNAVKFTGEEGTITVSCGCATATPDETTLVGEGPWTWVRVTDTGLGIAEESQAAIFEAFVQVDRGRTRRAGGTGLGLAISRRFARLMGGDLTVESEPGKGSTFTLWLPTVGSPDTTAREGTTPETPQARLLRARRGSDKITWRGIGEIGRALRHEADSIIEAWEGRLRADPTLPTARDLPIAQLEDHLVSFIAHLAQSLIVVDETGSLESDLQRDGAAMQQMMSQLHGQQRARLEWSERALSREYDVLLEELLLRVRQHGASNAGDVTLASGILTRLVMHARLAAVRAYLEAVRS